MSANRKKKAIINAFANQAQILEGFAKSRMIEQGLQGSKLLNTLKGVVIKNKAATRSQIRLEYNFYGDFVNRGRKAGKMPPVSAILKWIEDKKIVPYGNISKNQLAFLIARAIGRRGIAARPWLDNAVEDYENYFDQLAFDDLLNSILED